MNDLINGSMYFKVKEGLLRNDKFDVNQNGLFIKISKKISVDDFNKGGPGFFRCIILISNLCKYDEYLINEIIYDKENKEIYLNSSINQETNSYALIAGQYNVYSFGSDDILIILDGQNKKEKLNEYPR